MRQGPVNGPKWVYIYINLFFLFINIEACDIADNSTPLHVISIFRVPTLFQNQENDTVSTLIQFDANYMKSNQSK